MSDRCLKCCLPLDDCKCSFVKGRYRCFRCDGFFEVGDRFYSDAPNIVYHQNCYLAECIEVTP
jgi:hypothetical protein